MDKRAINKFAVQARRDLIESVTRRLNALGITDHGIEAKETRSTALAEYYAGSTQPLEGKDIQRRAALVTRLNEMAAKTDAQAAFTDLVEEVAYTWFNRIIAIRFMEVNDYLPSGTRVLSSAEQRNEPDIMREALDLEDELGGFAPDELALIRTAQDSQRPLDLDAMYQMLFIKQVNKLNESLPKLFEKTDDFMQLLFTPSYNRGVIRDLVEQIPEADFDIESEGSQGQVEIIGWLYQYYNTDSKDAAISSPKAHKFRGKEIASATQIFTPDWIVKYMVENSVGKTWIKHLMTTHPEVSEEDLAHQFNWQYYMPEASQDTETQEAERLVDQKLVDLTPQQLTTLDPSMGSGHILVYAFDLLIQIYRSEGYSDREASTEIVTSNLFGLDIDRRAYQLAYFSVMMKYRHYNRRALRTAAVPHLATVESSKDLHSEDIQAAFPLLGQKELQYLSDLRQTFKEADLTGSLTDTQQVDLTAIRQALDDVQNVQTILSDTVRQELNDLFDTAKILAAQYQNIVTNPPYMGSARMNKYLADFSKKFYPESKADLFAMFLEHFNKVVLPGGYVSMVTMQSWMFLSSFEQLRIHLLNTRTISNLMHMENNVMGIAFGTAVTITRNVRLPRFTGTYHQIKTGDVAEGKFPTALPVPGNRFNRANQANFSTLPGNILGYWVSTKMLNVFRKNKSINDFFEIKVGIQTGDNPRFYRQWTEIRQFDTDWVKTNKNGEYRKWFGNLTTVILWKDNGAAVKQCADEKGRIKSRPQNESFYFLPGISFSNITSSGNLSARFAPEGMIFDQTVPTVFTKSNESLENIMAYLNSKVALHIGSIVSPTMHFNAGEVSKYPYIPTENNESIFYLSTQNVEKAKKDWDSYEISWSFSTMPFIKQIADHNRNWTVESAYNQWAKEAEERFNQLKANEEELNRIFIDLYGLQDELTPEVADKDVSVRKADLPRDIKAFLSYFIGVVFGRYSLDVPGLAFAGGEWDNSKYQTFQPNADDIIVLTDADYFGDQRDIINRLKEFLTVTFGAEHLDENLRFIAEALGKKGATAEQQIRNYFLDDFYKKDHLSTYQKRPIYWQLDSGKQSGFRALMYLHRYDENTLAMVRTSYLHPLQEAYANQLSSLTKMIEVEVNSKPRNEMTKQIAKLQKQLEEVAKYDGALQHVANMHIALDLDDGVLVNHEKAQGGQKLLSPLK
ncbi:BREX-1 system adenine-specific DNA-methyltransferase PglX [Lacticaseibacillus absianus]|uniref:BREX-1 system adenine-specific DNA-methyltransferase PglX n=1 Tax=Lacticaseibacillus absianus TaxID=2729623 RepID=UPI0015CCEE67|nr:BREX-1 system adenine-specific DNA-methyltransferase PglX [Lacticaseibacillus absianus]